MLNLSEKAMRSLIEYLEAHDEDIANEMNDFGDLQLLYREITNSFVPYLKIQGWTSIKDQTPSHDEPIIYCISPKGHDRSQWNVGIAYWTVSEKWNPDIYSNKNYEGFTHWMPLPKHPNIKTFCKDTHMSGY